MTIRQTGFFWQSDDSANELKELTLRGFDVNPVSGEITDFNGNIFAKYIQELYQVCFGSDFNFYTYENGFWEKMSSLEFYQFLRSVLQEPRYGTWSGKIENEYFKALSRQLYIPEPFNNQKEFLNLENGMLDTTTYELQEHKQEFYSTIRIPLEYDPDAECPQFLEFLNQVFEGDDERIAVAQEWFGYLLTAENKAQKALFLYGTGANGKGVFTNILTELIGAANCSNVALTELSRAFSRVSLFGKTANISSENEVGAKGFTTQYFKAIVGGDIIAAEEKNKQGFSFTPTSKLVFALNSLPSTRDKSEAFYRRLSLLYFSAYFSEEKRDVNLTSKLKSELAGILNWALEGLERLRNNDFKFSKCSNMDELLKIYREEQNPILQFIDECVNINPTSRTLNSNVLAFFHNWAKVNGYMNFATISANKFWSEFEASCKTRGFSTNSGHSGNSRYHTGFILNGVSRQ